AGLYKIAVGGGPAVRLAQGEGMGRGATWRQDGLVVYAPGYDVGLWMVSDTGEGTPRRLTTPDPSKHEGSHRFPRFLPDGRSILMTVGTGGSWDDALIEAVTVDSGQRKVLIQGGSDARYLPGHLV